jgi:pimeloyl-ACP methyl ester carboxylesterase
MGEIDSQGAKIHFERLGPSDREAVVFIHGLVMDNLASFYFSVANAVSENYDVVLYDLRGHGKSSQTAIGYKIDDMVSDLHALVIGTVNRAVHLVGNSFGGVVAVSFARAYPELAKSIILIDAHLGEAGFADQMADTLSLQGEERDRQIAKSFEHWLGRHSERKRNRLAKHAEDLITRTSLVADIRATPPLSADDLKTLMLPVLALYGEHSDLREKSQQLLTALPNGKTKILAGCTHAILWEATAQLRSEIAYFLDDFSAATTEASPALGEKS